MESLFDNMEIEINGIQIAFEVREGKREVKLERR